MNLTVKFNYTMKNVVAIQAIILFANILLATWEVYSIWMLQTYIYYMSTNKQCVVISAIRDNTAWHFRISPLGERDQAVWSINSTRQIYSWMLNFMSTQTEPSLSQCVITSATILWPSCVLPKTIQSDHFENFTYKNSVIGSGKYWLGEPKEHYFLSHLHALAHLNQKFWMEN